eukprot:EG_transcript_22920
MTQIISIDFCVLLQWLVKMSVGDATTTLAQLGFDESDIALAAVCSTVPLNFCGGFFSPCTTFTIPSDVCAAAQEQVPGGIPCNVCIPKALIVKATAKATELAQSQ